MPPRFDLHPDTRQRLCPVTAGILAAALSATLAAAIDGDDTPYRIGLLVLIAAATALVALRTGLTARVIEKARQDGYDDGYADGRSVVNPGPVARLVSGGSGRTLTQRRTPQKLSQ